MTSKLHDNDFVSFLYTFDVICLSETFLSKPSDFINDIFSAYEHFFSPALKFQNGPGRYAGGVSVFIKTSCNLTVQQIHVNYDNTIVLHVKQPFKHRQNDIILVSTYVPPAASPYYKSKYNTEQESNGIVYLEQCIAHIRENYVDASLIIAGDLNSRTGNVQGVHDDLELNKYLEVNPSNVYNEYNNTHIRISEDAEINAFGRTLLSLCSIFDLYILNGVYENSGLFTFMSWRGNSVNDYFIVSDDLLMENMTMQVISRSESWHMPITLSIKCHKDDDEMHADMPINNDNVNVIECDTYMWDDEKSEEFHKNILDTRNLVNVNEMNVNINVSVSTFNNCILSAASCMKRKSMKNAKPVYTRSNWFDQTCKDRKRVVRKCLNRHVKLRTHVTKMIYIQTRKEYKKFLRLKRVAYANETVRKLVKERHTSTKFWQEVKKICRRSKTNNSIKPGNWYDHFKNAFSNSNHVPPICNEPIHASTIPYDVYNNYIKNAPISIDEVRKSVQSVKNGKAAGSDHISNEMIKTSESIILPFLTKLFQLLFDKGEFPDAWIESLIVPIFKKGNPELCDNYRPISLTSLVSKLYTNILNQRHTTYQDYNNIIYNEQGGYMKGFSPMEHVLTLYTMVMNQFSKNRKLYVCFVDFSKCFDSINRDALFKILEQNGIDGKLLEAIKSIYKRVLARVKVDNNIATESFECPIGLKQGCLCSPKLFTIFMNELSKEMNKHGKHGIQLTPGMQIIFHLLWADDVILASDTIVGLQNQINILSEQAMRLGMKVNLDKTKVMVFRKGGFLSKDEKWFYRNIPLEVVNSYVYLGVNVTTKLSFVSSTNSLVTKSKKALYQIMYSLKSINCHDFDVFIKLFDAKVKPILLYASEVWGMKDIIEVERVHLLALKRFLNVSKHCSNAVVYGETKRYPLSISCKLRVLKFWLKIQKLPQTRIVKQAYEKLLYLDRQGKHNWATDIKQLLFINGFGMVWIFHTVGCEKSFLNDLKTRLIHAFEVDWKDRLMNYAHNNFYSSFKTHITKELYLSEKPLFKPYRDALIKFRLCVSNLDCHRYKFNAIILETKLCPLCKLDKETEIHFMFKCHHLEQLRLEIIPKKYLKRRNLNTLVILMNSQNDRFNLAKYIYYAFLKRSNMISNV